MSWNKQTLELAPSPPSVRRARDWVGRVLEDIGRAELADSARLGVTELVTNALLHGDPPVAVTVRGTTDHPRIEVIDSSLDPPKPRSAPELDVDDDRTWSTVGRGLDLVAAHAIAWGADIDARGEGKVVWFEPSPEPHENPRPGQLFDLDEAVAAWGSEEPAATTQIDLCGFPVELFTHLRLHFNELGRELRLLALTNPDRYPLAVDIAAAYLQVEHERRHVRGLGALERAIAAGVDQVDLRYTVPSTAPATMSRISELLEQVYDTFADDTLLAVRPAPELLDLQRWYLGQFSIQAAGGAPEPWDGPTRLAR